MGMGHDYGITRNKSCSVYQRAKLLAPIIISIFPISSSSAGVNVVAETTVVDSSSVTSSSSSMSLSSSSLLRGRNNNPKQRTLIKTIQNYCGKSWGEANSSCNIPCPDGTSTNCLVGEGEMCWADLTSCPSMEILIGEESGLPPPQPPSLISSMTDGKFQFHDANGFVTSYTSTSGMGDGDGSGGDSAATLTPADDDDIIGNMEIIIGANNLAR